MELTASKLQSTSCKLKLKFFSSSHLADFLFWNISILVVSVVVPQLRMPIQSCCQNLLIRFNRYACSAVVSLVCITLIYKLKKPHSVISKINVTNLPSSSSVSKLTNALHEVGLVHTSDVSVVIAVVSVVARVLRLSVNQYDVSAT